MRTPSYARTRVVGEGKYYYLFIINEDLLLLREYSSTDQ